MKRIALAAICLLLVLRPFLAAGQDENLIDFPAGGQSLPAAWRQAPISAKVLPLASQHREYASKLIQRALSKYPAQVIAAHLEGVSLVGGLEFYQVTYGGTYLATGKRILLVYKPHFEPRAFEQRFHHEFSSLLLRAHQREFEARRWTAANPPGFRYRSPGLIESSNGHRPQATQVIAEEQKKTGGSGSTLLQLDPALMGDGFLTAYNRISAEQDVNETAAHLFTNPRLWDLCAEHPRIDQKVDVLIDFYRRIDPLMDRVYFRNLTRGENDVLPER